MSKNFFASIVFIGVLLTTPVYAETAPLNAGLVGSIWYGATPVVFDTEVKIHSAFYNESDREIEGVAVFRDNETELGKVSFIAKSRSVTPLSLSWRTTEGVHVLSVSIEGTDAMVTTAHTKTSIEIKKPVVVLPPKAPSKPLTLETVKTTTVQTILDLTEKVDTYTAALAESLQSEKVSTNPSPNQVREGQVLGIESEAVIKDSDTSTKGLLVTAKNTGVDGITWIVRNWQWGALLLLGLFLLLLRKLRRNS